MRRILPGFGPMVEVGTFSKYYVPRTFVDTSSEG